MMTPAESNLERIHSAYRRPTPLLTLTPLLKEAFRRVHALPHAQPALKRRLLPFIRNRRASVAQPSVASSTQSQGNDDRGAGGRPGTAVQDAGGVVLVNEPKGVPLQLVEEVSSVLKESVEREFNNGKVWVHELLKGSAVYIAPPEIRPRSHSLTERLEKIRNMQANAEYMRMVSNIPGAENASTTRLEASERQEMRSAKNQITAIINIMFTIVAVFVAVYWISPSVTDDIGYRILLSFFFCVVVGIAETWLYIRYVADPSPAPGYTRIPSRPPSRP